MATEVLYFENAFVLLYKINKKTLNLDFDHVPNVYAVAMFLKSHVAAIFVKQLLF